MGVEHNAIWTVQHPAIFERLIDKVLKGLQWKILVLYLDDIVVFMLNPHELVKHCFEHCIGKTRSSWAEAEQG